MTNNKLTDRRLAQLANRSFYSTGEEVYVPFGDEVVSMAAELQEYRNAPVSILRCFYVAYDGWLKNGANDGGIFNSESGLCANAYDYFKEIGVDSTGPLNEMHAAFVAAGLNEKLPFNESPEQYAEEQSRGGCHANSSRVEWVRRQIAAELQELRNAASGWIKCSDRMPEPDEIYLVLDSNEGVWTAYYFGDRFESDITMDIPIGVTHWQPLPAAPHKDPI